MKDNYDAMTDRELDALVAERVMGWKWRKWAPQQLRDSIAFHEQVENVRFLVHPDNISYGSTIDDDGVGILRSDAEHHRRVRGVFRHGRTAVAWKAMDPPTYSSDISAAWSVVEKMHHELTCIGFTCDGGYRVEIEDDAHGEGTFHQNVCRAICIAALRAKDAEQKVPPNAH